MMISTLAGTPSNQARKYFPIAHLLSFRSFSGRLARVELEANRPHEKHNGNFDANRFTGLTRRESAKPAEEPAKLVRVLLGLRHNRVTTDPISRKRQDQARHL